MEKADSLAGYLAKSNNKKQYKQTIKKEKLLMAIQTEQTAETAQNIDVQKTELPQEMQDTTAYKERLKQLPEVQALTDEINIDDMNTILRFGQAPSTELSKISDELLSTVKNPNQAEASVMLQQLTAIMDKCDLEEIKNPEKAQSLVSKWFKKASAQLEKIFAKYDNVTKELDKVTITLRQYENEISKSNKELQRMQQANQTYFTALEKYVAAGELGLVEIDNYKASLQNSNMSPDELRMKIEKLDMMREMLAQRTNDLLIAENVALQTQPMLNTMQMSNFNLQRKINSAFIISLPIFKNAIIQAIQLKKQAIQAKAMNDLDEKTNELLLRNAENTARQSVQIAQMASGSSVKMETLEQTYATIQKGIEDTRRITEEMASKRGENAQKLESMKADMKQKGFI